jgi:hypothetical protein
LEETVGIDRENRLECIARSLILPLLVGACAGEPRVLPPRTPPPRVMPNVAMPASQVPVHHGRVVLDVVDGPMRVDAKYDPSFVPPGGAPETARSGELCTTPCVVDLPRGRYRLYLSATAATDAGTGDVDDLVLGDGTYVYRRAPGRYKTPSIYNQIAPGALIVLGLTGMVIGSALLSNEDTAVPGGLVLGAGVAATVGGGIWGYDATRAETQDGATTFWKVQ